MEVIELGFDELNKAQCGLFELNSDKTITDKMHVLDFNTAYECCRASKNTFMYLAECAENDLELYSTMLNVLIKICDTYEENDTLKDGWGGGCMDKSNGNLKVTRAIGYYLNEIGGLILMQIAAYNVMAKNRCGSDLNYAWDDIGEWQA